MIPSLVRKKKKAKKSSGLRDSRRELFFEKFIKGVATHKLNIKREPGYEKRKRQKAKLNR